MSNRLNRLRKRRAPVSRTSSVERYQDLLVKLRERIVRGLGADLDPTFDEAATALDLLVDGELLVEAEHELLIVADYAIFDVRRNGRNAVERYRDRQRPSRRSNDDHLLAAMATARCSLLRVDAIEPGRGVAVTDLLGGPSRFIDEPDLAELADDGIDFVARTIDLGEAVITSGPALPLYEIAADDVLAQLAEELPDRDPARLVDLSPEESARVSATLWIAALDSIAITLDDALAEMEEAAELIEDPADRGTAPRLWLPGDPTNLVDLGQLGRPESRHRAADRKATPLPASRQDIPTIVPSRPSLTVVRPGDSPDPADHQGRIADYRRLRGRLLTMQERAVKSLKTDALDEAATRLGLVHDGVVTLGAEFELGVVMDFAIYDVRRQDQSAVERLAATTAAKLDDEGRAVLDAMVGYRFAMVRVTGHEPGAGVAFTDLLGGPPGFLFDIGLSQTAAVGLTLATRLVSPLGVTMTTGAALVLSVIPDDRLESAGDVFRSRPVADFQNLAPVDRAEVTAAVVRVALKQSSNVALYSHDATDPSAPLIPIGAYDPLAEPGGARSIAGLPGAGSSPRGKPARRPKKRKR